MAKHAETLSLFMEQSNSAVLSRLEYGYYRNYSNGRAGVSIEAGRRFTAPNRTNTPPKRTGLVAGRQRVYTCSYTGEHRLE
ncbi:hypothetical protein LBMAG47_07510 [Planctomycetia bacterium]|nr:hypothetical protein LBMAG47_07510 [Planctomycetia bacterium]